MISMRDAGGGEGEEEEERAHALYIRVFAPALE